MIQERVTTGLSIQNTWTTPPYQIMIRTMRDWEGNVVLPSLVGNALIENLFNPETEQQLSIRQASQQEVNPLNKGPLYPPFHLKWPHPFPSQNGLPSTTLHLFFLHTFMVFLSRHHRILYRHGHHSPKIRAFSWVRSLLLPEFAEVWLYQHTPHNLYAKDELNLILYPWSHLFLSGRMFSFVPQFIFHLKSLYFSCFCHES